MFFSVYRVWLLAEDLKNIVFKHLKQIRLLYSMWIKEYVRIQVLCVDPGCFSRIFDDFSAHICNFKVSQEYVTNSLESLELCFALMHTGKNLPAYP